MIWARLLLSIFAGGVIGVGAFSAAHGLLPKQERLDKWNGGSAVARADFDSQDLRAENRRFSTACGIGGTAGAIAMIGLFLISQRWLHALPPR